LNFAKSAINSKALGDNEKEGNEIPAEETKEKSAQKEGKSENSKDLEGWLTIASDLYTNINKGIPEIKTKVDLNDHTRINFEFEKAKQNGAKTKYDFLFHLKNGYIYYYADKNAEHLIEAIIIKDARKDEDINCFVVHNFNEIEYKICAESEKEKYNWYCHIQKMLNMIIDIPCYELGFISKNEIESETSREKETEKIKEQVVYIPTPSKKCNENWNIFQHGNDWECTCAEGFEQSPIDIPASTQLNDLAPNFVYIKAKNDFGPKSPEESKELFSTFSGLHDKMGIVESNDIKPEAPVDLQKAFEKTKEDEPSELSKYIAQHTKPINPDDIIIENENDIIKIKYLPKSKKSRLQSKSFGNDINKSFGAVFMNNGDVYYAKEIQFKTPSEHTIKGERFDMEMQVIHYGGDQDTFNKQVILCFLFQSKPGTYNKFLDSINVYDLPNKIETKKLLQGEVFIPDIFEEINIQEEQQFSPNHAMPPFSFYTYNGSLTTPPCTERTTVYVAKKPIKISSVVYGLFKEALNIPQEIDPFSHELTQKQVGQRIEDNTRATQNLNGRKVLFYDHELFGCGDVQKPKKKVYSDHYEKREVYVQDIVYVPGSKPTGIPGSFVIPNKVVEN
jgi:carbonic anhydrase